MQKEPSPTQDIPVLLAQAMALQQQGELAQAERLYEHILSRDSNQLTAIHLLGLAKRQQGHPGEAIHLLEDALSSFPRSALTHQNLGLALMDLHRDEEALVQFQYALFLKPNDRDSLLSRATALHNLHRDEEALAILERALATHGNFSEGLQNRGIILLDLQRPLEALASLDLALTLAPGNAAAHLARGNALMALLRPGEALVSYDLALANKPRYPEALLNRGNALLDLHRPAEALASCEEALVIRPDSAVALMTLGNTLVDLQRQEEALARFDQAIALQPDFPDAYYNRGHLLQTLERKEEALADYERALVLQPQRSDALINSATLLHHALRHEEALTALGKVLMLQPDNSEASVNLGIMLLDLGRAEEALATFECVLARRPHHIEALINLGRALLDLHRLQDALASFDSALHVEPRNAEALLNRGAALHQLGRHEEAMASYDEALAARPDFALAHSNKIFVLDYLPGVDFRAHQQARHEFCLAQASCFPNGPFSHPNPQDPTRRLVIGYVSADFKHHSAAFCFGPVLRHHDKDNFKVICYSGVLAEDVWTQLFRQYASEWRVTAGLSDEALDEQIRRDGVDILIDLSGHSQGNRLLVFARKPAPVQVTAWGYGGGTGLPMVDYQFTDPIMTPAETRPLFAEASFDLPCCITFEAPPFAPPVEDLPARTRGFVTFGTLNRLNKITPAVLSLWARILKAVPHAHLVLKNVELEAPQTRLALRKAFTDHGVDPDRLELRGPTGHRDHLATYGEVDIALDTFPQNGGITTWEALWMGVPVIAMLGDRPSSRISGAILHALSLGGWVSGNEADYLDMAVEKAADLDSLLQLRLSLRDRILGSPAGNPEAYTRAVEDGYRTMWKRWLEQPPPGITGRSLRD